ncbi:MAG: GNAT family N-acetyltransferase [Bernardetiaceae bacterium]|jgi:dTDP-4-amino-4,6-dideoxy-D-galactose acyltransferase|nr:GNAT family N-acetyltransferase [Bernardetiaceae bacterium]
MLPPFEMLAWDSEFFGYPVARLHYALETEADWTRACGWLTQQAVQLGYYTGPQPLPAHWAWPGGTARLVEERLVYHKTVQAGPPPASVAVYPAAAPEPALVALALASGEHTRFNTDPQIGRAKFEALYTLLITNLASGQLGQTVLVARQADQLQGLITVGGREGRAEVGLLAVNPGQQRRGLGRQLLQAAENWAAGQKLPELRVTTQKANTAAGRLCEKAGFTLAGQEFAYHFWGEECRND